jgi:hypothetical protein
MSKSILSHDPSAAIRQATTLVRRAAVAHDPVAWTANALPHIELWSKQVEILRAIDEHNRVAVRACHDSSKSFSASIVASWWLDSHPMGSARVITTAPTATQVRGILWVEINQLHEQAKLPGRVNQTEWWMGSYLAGIGRKPADYNPAAFQGMHARYPLIIIDEASGVPSAIIDAAETLATNVNAKVLMIGNPDDPTSLFADIHRDPIKHGYHTIKISAWDTPNFTDEPVSELLHEVLLSQEWVERRRTAWGVDHPFWISKVEAEFPSIDINSTIKLVDVLAARIPFSERQAAGGTQATLGGVDAGDVSANAAALVDATSSSVLGVDVAGSEDGDETVIRQALLGKDYQSARITNEWRTRSADPEALADFIVMTIQIAKPTKVTIDSIGVGWGILGSVRAHKKLPKGVAVEGFNGASSPGDKSQYGNARAELWWTTRLLFQNGKIDTADADNRDDLEAQLITPRYHINKGKIYIESKDDLNKRLGRSPDNADAMLYSLVPILTGGIVKVAPPPQQSIMPTHMANMAQRTSATTRAARIPTRRVS